MGNKLGAILKNYLKITTFIFCICLSSVLLSKPIEIDNINFQDSKTISSIEQRAKIYTIFGNQRGISLDSITVSKPGTESLKNYKTLSPRDKYAVTFLDENRKEIIRVGIGNPFYIHAQHIGYEDSDFFGGYIDAKVQIALPTSTDAKFIVLSSQENKVLTKINEIILSD